MSKYFLVEANEIPWGVCQRITYDWKEALDQYGKLKKFLEKVPCVIKLSSVETYIDEHGREKEYQKTIYEKRLAESKNITLLTEKVRNNIKELLEARQMYSSFYKEANENTLNMSHAIELINFSLLSGEQRDNVLYNIENNTIKRRISQTQLKYLDEINSELVTILNKCVCIDNKVKAINDKSQKYNESDAAYKKNKNYLKTLGIDIDTHISYDIPDISEVDLEKISKDNSYHMEVIKKIDEEVIEEYNYINKKDVNINIESNEEEKEYNDYIESNRGINSLDEQFKKVREKLCLNS